MLSMQPTRSSTKTEEEIKNELFCIPVTISNFRGKLIDIMNELDQLENQTTNKLSLDRLNENLKYLNVLTFKIQRMGEVLEELKNPSLNAIKSNVGHMVKNYSLEVREATDMLYFYKHKLEDNPVQASNSIKASRPNR